MSFGAAIPSGRMPMSNSVPFVRDDILTVWDGKSAVAESLRHFFDPNFLNFPYFVFLLSILHKGLCSTTITKQRFIIKKVKKNRTFFLVALKLQIIVYKLYIVTKMRFLHNILCFFIDF